MFLAKHSRLFKPYQRRCSLISHLPQFGERTAVIDQNGSFSYNTLLRHSSSISSKIHSKQGKNISYLCSHDYTNVLALHSIWASGAVAVPLHTGHTLPEIEHIIQDSQSELIIVSESEKEKISPLITKYNLEVLVLSLKNLENQTQAPKQIIEGKERDGLIIYTSGTTGKPKGVVLSHSNLEGMVSALKETWGWTQNDNFLLVLPLHHLHGLVVGLLTCLHSGAICQMKQWKSAADIWDTFIAQQGRLSVFMAVPTIYVKLLEAHQHFDDEKKKQCFEACQKLRLMTSGSSGLPEPIFQKWEKVSGHRLLERYGMSETGIILSNPLSPEENRRPNSVGAPLPGVNVKVVHDDEQPNEGELYVSGRQVFKKYYNKEKETKESFAGEWFKTGDSVRFDPSTETYQILGRKSMDIIKTGGYKLSALETEQTLLSHNSISEAVVIGIPDEVWGQVQLAVIVLKKDEKLDSNQITEWLKAFVAGHKIPRQFLFVESIPRNAMGKVNKKELGLWVAKQQEQKK